jgi:hypothetical protein
VTLNSKRQLFTPRLAFTAIVWREAAGTKRPKKTKIPGLAFMKKA